MEKQRTHKNTCLVCGHVWIFGLRKNTKFSNAAYCPKCKAKAWDKGHNLRCETCERRVMIPPIHHINGNKYDNRKVNRLALCVDCHTAIHHGIGQTARLGRGRTNKRRNYIKCTNKLIRRLLVLNERWINRK